jgi:RNA polymerase sigma factor (sigma-70 family)
VKGEMSREESHDRDLVEKSLDGSARAFGRLVERYHALVFSVVRGIMGQRDEVEDVVQEIFIKVYRNLAGYRGEARLSTWIYRIARNEAINAVSRSRPDTEPLDESSGHVSREAGPEERLERKHATRFLEELLTALDEQHRIAIELRYMGEKSYAEIAEIMDIPIGTVKTYIYRAKAAMKKRLSMIQSSEEAI